MARASGIVWQPRDPRLSGLGSGRAMVKISVGLAAFTKGFAKRVEDYAKEHAPWDDRTGDAREGLNAKGYQRLTEYTIVLSHGVDYGIWLEIRWNGTYAIILPTLEVMGPRFMAELNVVGLGGLHTLGGGGNDL